MSILNLLDTTTEEPIQALLNMFSGTEQWHIEGGRPLQSSDFDLTELGKNEFADNVWSWKVSDSSPVIYDMGGEVFVNEAEDGKLPKLRRAKLEERFNVERGIVALFEDYGGFVVVVDNENEDDETLSEYAVTMLDL